MALFSSLSGFRNDYGVLSASGTMRLDFAENSENNPDYGVVPGAPAEIYTRLASSQVSAGLGIWIVLAETYREAASGGGYDFGIKVTLTGGTIHKFPLVHRAYIDPPYIVAFTATLSWTIDIDVRLACNWARGSAFSGGETEAGILALRWEGDPAGTAALSVTLDNTALSGGQTASSTSASSGVFNPTGVLSADADVIGVEVLAGVSAPHYNSALTYTTIAECVWAYDTAALTTAAHYSYTERGVTQYQDYGTNSAKATANLASVNPSGGYGVGVYAQLLCAKPRVINLVLDAYAFTDRIKVGGTALNPDFQLIGFGGFSQASTTEASTGGHLTKTFTQRSELVYHQTTIDPFAQDFLGSTNYGPIAAQIPTSWMTPARGYDSPSVSYLSNYGANFFLKDKRIEGMNILLSAEFEITGGTDSAVTGGTRRTWTTKQSLLSYRYLQVEVGTAIASGGKIKIVRDSGATWGMVTSYEWLTDKAGLPIVGAGPFILDLLNPSNRPGSVETDNWPTTWPNDDSPSAGIRRGENWLTGPGWVDRLEVLGSISGGGATTISGVTLVRAPSDQTDRAALVTCLMHQGGWYESQMPTGGFIPFSGNRKRAFFGLTCDGRVLAAEETDAHLNSGNSSLTGNISLSDLFDSLDHARNSGITPTMLCPPATGGGSVPWFNRNLPASGLMGAGWLWNVLLQGWICTVDMSLDGGGGGLSIVEAPPEGSANLDYQLGVVSLAFPANIGDVFGHAGTSTTTGATLVVGVAMIHSQVYGAVVGDGVFDPVTVGTRVRSGQSIPYPDERGSDVSDALGYFASGPEWLRGFAMQHDAYTDELSVIVQSAARHRIPMRFVAPNLGGLEIINPAAGWMALTTTEAGQIRWRRWDFPVPMGASPVADALITSGYSDRQPSLFYWQGQRTYLLFWRRAGVSGDGIYEIYSDDDGDTWSAPAMSIASGQYPRTAVDISGGVLRSAWVADTGSIGNLKGTWQAAGDASPSAVFTFTELGASALRTTKTGFDISAAPDSASRINLTCTIEGEFSTSNWYSEDDGRHWTRS
ncbi:hypothetical protein [Armatimonas sp.]|uniref:hypothetical protein n=1 Tax=Armatimonas sp. TaxID=1872638 RepID=UPI00374C9C65